jgi:hypothetical protein
VSLPVSPRTIIRDAVVNVLNMRTDKDSVRVPNFDVSLRYLTPDQTNKRNTYCVIVGDESPTSRTMSNERWDMQLKVVCYAHDTDDPHAIIDGMIEDAQDAMVLVREDLRSFHVVLDIESASITSDERTTESLPWGQAVRTWTVSHDRK